MTAIPANSTASRVIAFLEPFGLKEECGDGSKYRANSPYRPGSDSHAFTLKIDDGEHGAFHDKVTDEGGSLYKFCDDFHIPHPNGKRDEATNTKRVIRNLNEYAGDHGLDGDYLRAHGWEQTTYTDHGVKHPAIKFPTATGERWRLLDVTKNVYRSEHGYQTCWYGLDRAIDKHAKTLVFGNGEIAVLAADYYGIAVFCLTAGEKAIPIDLLAEFKMKVNRDQPILIALDCDKKGRATAIKIRDQLITAGYTKVRAVDLLLTTGGDLADLCKLYTTDTATRLSQLPDLETEPDVKEASATKPEKPDNDTVATMWAEKYGQDRRYDPARGQWLFWDNNRCWKTEEGRSMDHERQIKECLRALKLTVTHARINDVMALCGIHSNQIFTTNKTGLLNFQNGTLELASGKLRDHDRQDGLTNCIPYDFQDGGPYPTIAQMLAQNIPDPAGQQAFMAHIGGALIGDTAFHKTLILYGPTHSGKTTLLDLAQRTCGYEEDNFAGKIIFSPENDGLQSRYSWHGRRMVCLDEFPENAIKEDGGEDLFKAMTAHSGVSMRTLYKPEITANKWRPKMMFATNNKVGLSDRSGAAFRRIIIISCPNERSDDQLDTNLKLAFDAELGAFASACLKAWSTVAKSGSYPESAAMRALSANVARQGDGIKLMVYECLVIEAGKFVPTAQLYSAYLQYCADNGLKAAPRTKFTDAIQMACPTVTSVKRRAIIAGNSKPVWGLLNIRFRTDADPDPSESVPC